jgi:Zn-dependent protease
MDVNYNRLTDDLRAVLARARREAGLRHAAYADVEHLMLGLLKHQSGTAYEMLKYFGTDTNALYGQIAAGVGIERAEPIEIKGLTHAAEDALSRTEKIAADLHHHNIDSGHLLLSLMEEPNGLVHDALATAPLDLEKMRTFMRDSAPQTAPSAPAIGRPLAGGRRRGPHTAPSEQAEYVLIPTRTRKAGSSTGPQPSLLNRWGKWPWIIGGIALLVAYLVFFLPGRSLATFVLVFIGWIFSLTLHEFSHALVAYLGGDYTVKEKGYLSFNPLKYTHPLLSIVLPLVFLALGGIGLPGGAVYIERHRLRNKWWGAAVSAAGPAANLLLAGVLALPFALGLVDYNVVQLNLYYSTSRFGTGFWQDATIWSAVAFLAMLQVTAVLFNLIPIPPLDGYGIIEPLLDERTRMQLSQFGTWGIFLIFIAMWYIPPFYNGFFNMVLQVTHTLKIPGYLVTEGFNNFMFWRNPPS